MEQKLEIWVWNLLLNIKFYPFLSLLLLKPNTYIHLLWVKTENPGARKFDIRFSIDNSIANITLYSQVPNKRVGWLF